MTQDRVEAACQEFRHIVSFLGTHIPEAAMPPNEDPVLRASSGNAAGCEQEARLARQEAALRRIFLMSCA